MYKRVGFTIIEIMIFLAITGMMIALFLVNSGSLLDSQRYRDTILSLQTFLQDQYSETLNIRNSISGNFTCSINNTNLLTITNTGSSTKGQSDCLLVGKYIRTTDTNGTSIDSYPVVAVKQSCIDCKSDLQAFKENYLISQDASNSANLKTTHQLLWGAFMLKPDKTARLQFSMVILKSPTSGNIFTLISPLTIKTTKQLVDLYDALDNSNSTKNDLVICVDKRNLNLTKNMGIRILANSFNSSGVKYLGDGDNSVGGCQ